MYYTFEKEAGIFLKEELFNFLSFVFLLFIDVKENFFRAGNLKHVACELHQVGLHLFVARQIYLYEIVGASFLIDLEFVLESSFGIILNVQIDRFGQQT